MGKESRSFGTHDGSFHADEVTACALLLLFDLIDKEKIHRTRDPKVLDRCEFVCDVGGIYDPSEKLFDHHQVDYQGSLSSAGMILRYLLDEKILSQAMYDHFNANLMMGVDAHDNGRGFQEMGYCSFSHVVSNFTPPEYDAPATKYNQAFFEALGFVLGHLGRLKERFEYMVSCREDVAQVMEKKEDYLLFEKAMPWLEIFFSLGGEQHPARFVVMPSGEHWKLRGIPPKLSERMSVRVPLPKEWAGLSNSELEQVSGISGAIFCHKGRFISVWETKEAALEALKKVEEVYR